MSITSGNKKPRNKVVKEKITFNEIIEKTREYVDLPTAEKKELKEVNKELKSTTNKDLIHTLIPIEILLFSLITTALL